MPTTTQVVHAEVHPGAWKLKPNTVWSIPNGVGEVRFEIKVDSGPWQGLLSVRALAIALDGRIWGVRRLLKPQEAGLVQTGRVSIAQKKYRAFTSSRLFERPDGSLVNVAVLIVGGVP